MKDKKLSENHLSEEIYNNRKFTMWKSILVLTLCFIIGFLFHFPFRESISKIVTAQINSIRSCPITFEEMDISFLFPKVTLVNPSVSGRCIKKPGRNLQFDSIAVGISGPSFYPPGIKFNITMIKGETKLYAYPSVSFSKTVVKITDDSIIDATSLADLFEGKQYFNGSFSLESIITINSGKISDAKFNLKSNNLEIPAQNISGFNVPSIPLKTFSLLGTYNKNKLKINSFIFGTPDSPISGEIKGNVKINKITPAFSKLDLTTEIKFSENFLDSFAIIKMLLSGNPPRGGFYHFKLTGTFANPTPKPI